MSSDRWRGAASAFDRNSKNSIASAGKLQPFAWSPNAAAILVFLILALVLSTRKSYIAIDDLNYVVNYFSLESDWYSELVSGDLNWWRFIIEEPLWRIYSITVGALFGPETALHVTIFFSSFAYLLFASRLAGGNWPITALFFVLEPNLGSQMYFNQIRQGVALTVFFALLSSIKLRSTPARVVLAATCAALVHSSFLYLIASSALYIVKPSIRVILALLGAAALILVSYYVNIIDLVDLGRRQTEYALGTIVNINWYILTLVTYVPIFYLLRPRNDDQRDADWYYLTIVATIFAVGFTATFEAGGRVAYLAEAMVCVLVAKNTWRRGGIEALAVWVISFTISNISAYIHAETSNDSMITKWQLIIMGE